ncbi:Late [Abeliophyllum distichum]|uniref:Late n=1 Tax=Abeliophyllum distichum TaxID=126358 RepID=A0ABD1UEY1_9LAMI
MSIQKSQSSCYVNCDSPICKAECKNRIPNCNGLGAACYDPRFIGGDGVVFYFHGKSNEHFSLVSDSNLQINASFIGLRPAERRRDYTWIQGLGVLFGSHNFSVEATKETVWDDNMDHLKFSNDGKEIILPEGSLSEWNSQENYVKLERISSKNNVVISIPEVVEIAVNVVPITREDDRIHNYQIPSDDCFAHLEVQFRFFGLSPKVEGVLVRTYQPDFESPAKLGVAMPVVGGEDKYRTTSIFSTDCKYCMFSPVRAANQRHSSVVSDYGMLDCPSNLSRGNGIVCKK